MERPEAVTEALQGALRDASTVNVRTAAELLHVSRQRIWALIKDGKLRATPNPLDRREHLIPVQQLAELARGTTAEGMESGLVPDASDGSRVPEEGWPLPLSDGIASNPAFQSVDHEDYLASRRHSE